MGSNVGTVMKSDSGKKFLRGSLAQEAAVGRTRGAGAGGEGDLQSLVRASDGKTAPGQAKDAVGGQLASGRHIPESQGLAGFG